MRVVLMTKHLCAILMIVVLLPTASAAELRPFTSDGCSAFPDGTYEEERLWQICCIAHDYAYWMGGTKQDRENADLDLQTCVASVGQPEVAALMLTGVRVGGTPYLPTKFRWGYGWPWFRGYKELSEAELQQVEALQDAAEQEPVD